MQKPLQQCFMECMPSNTTLYLKRKHERSFIQNQKMMREEGTCKQREYFHHRVQNHVQHNKSKLLISVMLHPEDTSHA